MKPHSKQSGFGPPCRRRSAFPKPLSPLHASEDAFPSRSCLGRRRQKKSRDTRQEKRRRRIKGERGKGGGRALLTFTHSRRKEIVFSSLIRYLLHFTQVFYDVRFSVVIIIPTLLLLPSQSLPTSSPSLSNSASPLVNAGKFSLSLSPL